MDNDLIQLLESAGFTPKEAQIYLALLELSQGTVTEIAKLTKLKRSIIYVILEGLMKRGHASEIPDKKINTYQAADPLMILRQLQGATKNFNQMLPLLQTLHNKGKKRPKITYHESKEGIWKIYDEMAQTKEGFFITSYERINKIFPGVIDVWSENYKKGLVKLSGHHLVANNLFDLDVARRFVTMNQDVRYLEHIKEFNMDFAIYNNKLAITSLEDEPFIVVIESEDLVKSISPLFEIAWAKGKDLL